MIVTMSWPVLFLNLVGVLCLLAGFRTVARARNNLQTARGALAIVAGFAILVVMVVLLWAKGAE